MPSLSDHGHGLTATLHGPIRSSDGAGINPSIPACETSTSAILERGAGQNTVPKTAFALVYRKSPVYNRPYVYRILYSLRLWHPMVQAYVLTDDPVPFVGAATVQAKHQEWGAWWSKLELFRPGAFGGAEKVVFLDLDTIVCGSLGKLLGVDPPQIAGLSDFYRHGRFASGVMVFKPSECAFLYEAMRIRWQEALAGKAGRGDQNFIESACAAHGVNPVLLQERISSIISYKVSGMGDDPPPDGTALVCFHGVPKPHECGGWVKEFWNGESHC